VNLDAMCRSAVRIRLQIRFRLVVDGTGGGLALRSKESLPEKCTSTCPCRLHRIDSGANEVAVKKNIAGHSEQRDVGQPGLQHTVRCRSPS